MGKKELSIFLCVLALGAFLRFYHITTTPPGLYPDEAMNGNNALEALHTGHFSVFYPDNNGREGLFINIQAISVWLFGREAWALRVVSAIFGTLTILGVYLAARELLKNYNIALLAAFFTATSYWHVSFSRIGFRAITTPFFLSFGLYFLLRGFRANPVRSSTSNGTGSIGDMVWAGIFTGLGFQGYLAFRFVPLVFTVPIVWKLWEQKRERNQPQGHAERSEASQRVGILRSAHDDTLIRKPPTHKLANSSTPSCAPCAVALFLLITFVTALPIGWYFFQHPADFIGRSKDVSVLSAPSPMLEFVKTNALTIGMFFIRGDCNDRHNYTCKPELNSLVALFFTIGVFVALQSLIRNPNDKFQMTNQNNQIKDNESRSLIGNWKLGIWILLAWLFFMSLPATLTREGMPHALRAIGMVPPVMILSGLGAYAVFQFALSFRPRIKVRGKLQRESRDSAAWMPDQIGHDKRKKTVYSIAALLVLAITFQTYYDYFIAWARRTQTANAFAADMWHLGQYLDKTPPDIKKYVIVDLNSDQNSGLPVVAQTVAFATDTFRPEERLQKNLTYILSRDALFNIEIPDEQPAVIAPLQKNDPETIRIIHEKFPEFWEVRHHDFLIFQNF